MACQENILSLEGLPCLGFDLRTLADDQSFRRGIGHYALHHLEAVAKINLNSPSFKLTAIHEEEVPSPSWRPKLEGLGITWMSAKNYKSGSFDLLHTPDPMGLQAGYVSPLTFFDEARITALFHDLIPLRFYREKFGAGWPIYLNRLERWKNSQAYFLCNSNFTESEIRYEFPFAIDRIYSISAGLNMEKVSIKKVDFKIFKKRLGIMGDFCLFVGATDAHKNFDGCVRAVIEANKQKPIQLAVTGRPNEFTRMWKQKLTEMGLESLVIFTDFLERSELEALYQKAVALIFLSHQEGFGFPALEAMAHGCPVICSNTSSLPEVVGEAALMHDPLDIEGAAQSIIKLKDDLKLAETLRRKGQQQARLFTWEAVAKRTIAVWKKVLATEPLPLGNPSRRSVGVNWISPIFNCSGYASESRSFLVGMENQCLYPSTLAVGRYSQSFSLNLPLREKNILSWQLDRLRDAALPTVMNMPAKDFIRTSDGYHVGRTTFETQGLPQEWVDKCNQMDEIWLPSNFNMEFFLKAGVTVPLLKIPEGVDTHRFLPGLEPLDLGLEKDKVTFLSIFEWTYRKGWDLLLTAWAEAFQASDNVQLVLRTFLASQMDEDSREGVEKRIEDFLKHLGRSRDNCAPIVILSKQITEEDMPRLYAAADVYVAPSRGEGWGRPQMEAMSAGLPVIATGWSGNLDFMNEDNAWLIKIDGLEVIDDREEFPFYRGQRWAKPNLEHFVDRLRLAARLPALRRAIGLKARQDMLDHWNWERISALAVMRIKEITAGIPVIQSRVPLVVPRPASLGVNAQSICVKWEGSQFVYHSLAHVNRQLCLGLLKSGKVALSIIPYEPDCFDGRLVSAFQALAHSHGKPLPGATQVHVRHQWPPNFNPPDEGAWVMIQPWEFGGIPHDWVPVMRDQVDEIWVPSTWVKDCYVASGIPQSKVVVIPNGVDFATFSPEGKKFPLRTKKKFKFLFLGGTIYRKGIDILLNAYQAAFQAKDDVCLVIKGQSGHTYRGSEMTDRLQAMVKNPLAPAVEYLTDGMEESAIASLYRACDVFVLPYRGEGFGLPIIEAMACGLPVMVTEKGASRDFVKSEWAYLIPSQSHSIANVDGLSPSALGYWLEEPDEKALVALLREAYDNQAANKEKGRCGTEFAKTYMGWDAPIQLMMDRIAVLAKTQPCRLQIQSHGQSSLVGEAFLYEPDFHQAKWVSVLLSFAHAFASGEPVALILPIDPIKSPLEKVQQSIIQVMIEAQHETFPDIIVLDKPHELLDFLKPYAQCCWITKTGELAGNRGTSYEKRLATAIEAFKTPASAVAKIG